MKWKCPCCGYYTLPISSKDALAYICPVCFWEIDTFITSEVEPSDQNHGLTLQKARKNFIKLGACCKDMMHHVRQPNDDELNGLE